MLRYRCWPCLGLLLLAGGCAVPGARENAAAVTRLVEEKVPAPLVWRRDAEADRAARERAEELLADGLDLREAIAVAFLASPSLQIAFEELEISRAELVAATRPANPVAIVGSREPGGDLAAFYPERTISVGVLQNVISLLTIPDRRATARHNLERVRYEVAQRAAEHAAQVAEGWYRYSAARERLGLYQRSVNTIRAALDGLAVMVANEEAEPADIEDGRIELFGMEASQVRAQLDVDDERARLENLLGIAGWRDDWEISGALPDVPAIDPDPAVIEAAALQRRFDVLAAMKSIDQRLRELSMQRRFRWLTDFEIGVFRDKAIGSTPFTGPTVAVELPLFDQRQAALLDADARLRSAMRQLEVAQLALRQEVRRHAAAVQAMRGLVQRHERDILPYHQRAAAALGGGDPNELPRLNARLVMLEAERERIDMLRDYWVARSALAQAGGDWLGLSGVQ